MSRALPHYFIKPVQHSSTSFIKIQKQAGTHLGSALFDFTELQRYCGLGGLIVFVCFCTLTVTHFSVCFERRQSLDLIRKFGWQDQYVPAFQLVQESCNYKLKAHAVNEQTKWGEKMQTVKGKFSGEQHGGFC